MEENYQERANILSLLGKFDLALEDAEAVMSGTSKLRFLYGLGKFEEAEKFKKTLKFQLPPFKERILEM